MTSLSPESFSHAMAQCGPFPSAPHIAVAVSGGADSMAMCLLLYDWVSAQGGALTALTVDHGLREESASEAAEVKTWLKARGINHHTLALTASPPATGIQAWAREERYARLIDWCHQNHILYLALGHHIDDQRETIFMRQERGSGVRGLAGMSSIMSKESITLLRPLLGFSKSQLIATCTARQQPWVEDSSNQNLHFRRVQIRQQENTEHINSEVLAKQRIALDEKVAQFLARHVTLSPLGFARCDASHWRDNTEITHSVWQQLIMTIGGHTVPPRNEVLRPALHKLQSDKTFTVAGCMALPFKNGWLIAREPARAENVSLQASMLWDNRFALRTSLAHNHLIAGALTEAHFFTIRKELNDVPMPTAIYASLPAIYDGKPSLETLCCIPHLQWCMKNSLAKDVKCWFAPRKPLVPARFFRIHN